MDSSIEKINGLTFTIHNHPRLISFVRELLKTLWIPASKACPKINCSEMWETWLIVTNLSVHSKVSSHQFHQKRFNVFPNFSRLCRFQFKLIHNNFRERNIKQVLRPALKKLGPFKNVFQWTDERKLYFCLTWLMFVITCVFWSSPDCQKYELYLESSIIDDMSIHNLC